MSDAAEIARALARVAPRLCAELLPLGRKEGSEWRCGSVAGDAGKSLGVHLHGTRAGIWSDFATGECGDALDLVAAVKFRGDRRHALDWARAWLGLPGASRAPHAGPAAPPAPSPSPDDAAAAQAAARDVEKRRRYALALFLGAQPTLRGTPVEAYLRGRGIDLAALGVQPRALRFHTHLPNSETGRALPAMVAAVVDGAGRHVATHRTWLAPDGRGGWTKAPLRTAKMSIGSVSGGTIRLARGVSGRALRDAPDGETICIAEGIETGLSVAVACRDLRVVAAVALGNMQQITLPPAVRTVILAADNDGDNAAALRGLQRAVNHFAAEGRTVRIARPPAGFGDFNDLLRGITEGAP